jgi:hypothetical protein
MALSPTLIIERRRGVLVAEWKQNPLIVVQVESPAVLPVLTFLDDRGQGAGVGPVGRRSQTNTAIVSRAGDPDRNASVWVRASYTGYRTAYIGFLNHVYGTQATTVDLAGYDVDHLLNRARSPGGAGYIRHRGRQFGGEPGLGTAVREGSEQPGLLRQPAPAAANLELDDMRQARQPVSAKRPERRRRHQSASHLFPDARHGRQRSARGTDVDAELCLRHALTYKSMKRSRV